MKEYNIIISTILEIIKSNIINKILYFSLAILCLLRFSLIIWGSHIQYITRYSPEPLIEILIFIILGIFVFEGIIKLFRIYLKYRDDIMVCKSIIKEYNSLSKPLKEFLISAYIGKLSPEADRLIFVDIAYPSDSFKYSLLKECRRFVDIFSIELLTLKSITNYGKHYNSHYYYNALELLHEDINTKIYTINIYYDYIFYIESSFQTIMRYKHLKRRYKSFIDDFTKN